MLGRGRARRTATERQLHVHRVDIAANLGSTPIAQHTISPTTTNPTATPTTYPTPNPTTNNEPHGQPHHEPNEEPTGHADQAAVPRSCRKADIDDLDPELQTTINPIS